jgi:tetratricopeptide (TPR) repeat protein
MAAPTKITHGNEEHLVKEALEHADAKKAKGNSLFKEGQHSKAAEEYRDALNELQKLSLSDQAHPQPEVGTLTVTLHSNLTACHQAMGQYEQAAAEAQVVYILLLDVCPLSKILG